MLHKKKWVKIVFLGLPILLALSTITYCNKHHSDQNRLHSKEPVAPQSNKQETWVTVFVHGIMSIQPHLTLQNVMRFVRDDVAHTTYSKTVEYMRLDPYFYLNQAMQEFGLKKNGYK